MQQHRNECKDINYNTSDHIENESENHYDNDKDYLLSLYKCQKCKFFTNDVGIFADHLKTDKENDQSSHFKCIYCGFEKENVNELVEHIKNVHSKCIYQCVYCPEYRYASEKFLERHFNEKHAEKNPVKLECSREGVKKYECLYCDCSFNENLSIIAHIYENHVNKVNVCKINSKKREKFMKKKEKFASLE